MIDVSRSAAATLKTLAVPDAAIAGGFWAAARQAVNRDALVDSVRGPAASSPGSPR